MWALGLGSGGHQTTRHEAGMFQTRGTSYVPQNAQKRVMGTPKRYHDVLGTSNFESRGTRYWGAGRKR